MKSKIVLGSCIWVLLITLGHLHVNVGWARAGQHLRVFLGMERAELLVGFLPVT